MNGNRSAGSAIAIDNSQYGVREQFCRSTDGLARDSQRHLFSDLVKDSDAVRASSGCYCVNKEE